jgi:hypothetical protein
LSDFRADEQGKLATLGGLQIFENRAHVANRQRIVPFPFDQVFGSAGGARLRVSQLPVEAAILLPCQSRTGTRISSGWNPTVARRFPHVTIRPSAEARQAWR